MYVNFSDGPAAKSGLWRWTCARGFFEHWKPVGGSGKVGEAFTEKAVLPPHLEKEEYVYEADKSQRKERPAKLKLSNNNQRS